MVVKRGSSTPRGGVEFEFNTENVLGQQLN